MRGGNYALAAVVAAVSLSAQADPISHFLGGPAFRDLFMKGRFFQPPGLEPDHTAVAQEHIETLPPSPACDDAIRMFQTIMAGHMRPITSPEDLTARTARAMKAAIGTLPRAEGKSVEAVLAGLSKLEANLGESIGPILVSPEGQVLIRCGLGKMLSGLTGTEQNEFKVYDAFYSTFLSEMDPHSEIYREEAAKRTEESAAGKKIGYGISYDQTETGDWILDDVVEGSPAQHAGLRPGDVLLSIRKGTQELEVVPTATAEAISSFLSAPKGTPVEFEIRRSSGYAETLTVIVGEFDLIYVKDMFLPNGVLHLQVSSFGANVARQTRERILRYPDAKGVILDLRFNGGGFLDEASDMVDLFIDRGLVASVWDRDRKLAEDSSVFARESGELTDRPLVVLINDFSASASELVAQTLSASDYGRGVLIGRRTYGKGTVGGIYAFQDHRYMVMTEGAYYTAGGKSPHAIGVWPDLEVPDPAVEQILLARQKAAQEGKTLQPIREADEPYTLGPFDPISEPEQLVLGERAVPNLLWNILALLPPGSLTIPGPIPSYPDPGLELSKHVLEALAAFCDSYRSDSCRVKPSLISSLQGFARRGSPAQASVDFTSNRPYKVHHLLRGGAVW